MEQSRLLMKFEYYINTCDTEIIKLTGKQIKDKINELLNIEENYYDKVYYKKQYLLDFKEMFIDNKYPLSDNKYYKLVWGGYRGSTLLAKKIY